MATAVERWLGQCVDQSLAIGAFHVPSNASHCALLVDHRAEIIGAIGKASAATVRAAIRELCSDPWFAISYPGVRADFIERLFDVIGAHSLARIDAVFFNKPYAYGAGWPDLTLVGSGGVRFVEVKTTDLFHVSQVRFARELAMPLGLACSVVNLVPQK